MADKVTRIDDLGSVKYIGEADAGQPPSAATWQIQRVTVSGSVTVIEWANGDSGYENVWDNRASLNYF